MIQEDDVIGGTVAQSYGLSSAQTGVHLNPIAAKNALSHHKIHFLVVHGQSPDTHADEGFPPCGLVLCKAPLSCFPVQQICHGKRREGFMYDQQPAFEAEIVFPLRNHNDPDGVCQILIIGRVFQIFRLGDEYMGQLVAALHFEQTIKVMHLVTFYAKPMHQA